MKFMVMVREVHVVTVEVEAPASTGIDKVKSLAGDALERGDVEGESFSEYSHTMEPWHWTVENSDGQQLE